MKASAKFLLSLVALGLICASPLVRAQDTTTPAPAAPAAPAKHAQGGKRVKKMVEEHDKMLIEKLKLTAEQQEKLAAIRKEEGEQLKVAQGDRAKMREVAVSYRAQVRAILTPEQQKEFDAMPAEGRGGKKGKKAGEAS